MSICSCDVRGLKKEKQGEDVKFIIGELHKDFIKNTRLKINYTRRNIP